MSSKPKPRRKTPTRPQPQVDPERAHDDAMRVLRAEYYGGVRGITEDLKARVASGEIASEDALSDAVHQEVDGSYWVIHAHANFQVLLCSDHHDASFEEYGEVPLAADGNVNWAALAFAILERDVRDQMGAEGVEVVEGEDLEEARRQPAHGDKHDYPKIDLFVDGSYAFTTTWARTIKQAIDQYVAKSGLDPRRVTAKRQESLAREYPARAKPGNWGPGVQWVPSEAKRPRPALRGTRRAVVHSRRRPGRT